VPPGAAGTEREEIDPLRPPDHTGVTLAAEPRAPRGPCRRAAALAAPALAALLAACGPGGAETSRELYELERLAFVPAAKLHVPGASAIDYELADCSLATPILMDRFEATERDWEHYFGPDHGGVEEPAFTTATAALDPTRLDWPVVLDYRQAERLAEARGMRLPLAAEWVHVATGGRGLAFPWGSRFQASWANTLELGLRRPAPVGSFENGRSQRFGCYDLIGNVGEWVADRVPGYSDAPAAFFDDGVPFFDAVALEGDRWRSVMGGSFTTRYRETFGSPRLAPGRLAFHARTVDLGLRAPDIGARFCADAGPYLATHAAAWGVGADDRARIEAVGRRWAAEVGREAVVPLLEELAAAPEAPLGLAWLLAGARGPR
jgi:hypothetical protein